MSFIVPMVPMIPYLLGTDKHKARQSPLSKLFLHPLKIYRPIPPVYRLDYEQTVAKARAQLGNEAFARTWAEGRTKTLEQAMAADHT